MKTKVIHSCFFLILTFLAGSCQDQVNGEKKKELAEPMIVEAVAVKKPLSKAFKSYWYGGNAEITSYQLSQARYGELRDGKAVLIYVTEPFLPDAQVKADQNDSKNIPVLKLNTTKKYLTGIYPYSIMTSSFYPVYDNEHAQKISFSSQEWCGHVYAQLNNREDFEIKSHSYFATEADQDIYLTKTPLEDEVWNKIRLNPKDLPTGEIEMIPSFEFIRLTHKELKIYKAVANLTTENGLSTYEIFYPNLNRTLKIEFSEFFPHTIEKWTDAYKGGYGQEAKIVTSTATKIKTIRTPYWSQNHNSDIYLRDSLGLN